MPDLEILIIIGIIALIFWGLNQRAKRKKEVLALKHYEAVRQKTKELEEKIETSNYLSELLSQVEEYIKLNSLEEMEDDYSNSYRAEFMIARENPTGTIEHYRWHAEKKAQQYLYKKHKDFYNKIEILTSYESKFSQGESQKFKNIKCQLKSHSVWPLIHVEF